MLTYSFENRGNETLYEYLYRRIRSDILDGTLKTGEALPSKRAFAKNLNISVITVENAYAQLQMEGYIYSLPRKGFFVSDLSDAALYFQYAAAGGGRKPKETPGEEAHGSRKLNETSGEEAYGGRKPNETSGEEAYGGRKPNETPGEEADGSRKLNETSGEEAYGIWSAQPLDEEGHGALSVQAAREEEYEIQRARAARWWADFSSNQTQADSFPFSNWAKLSREVLSTQKELLMQNPPTQGTLELREAIAGHLQAFRGIQVKADQIVVGAGTEYLYGLLIQLFGTDKVYAAENPGYRKVSQVFASFRVRSRLIFMDEEGLSVERLSEEETNVVHVTPSHHFPTGITMPVNRRYELLGWAAQGEDRYLIEDDYDSELRMSRRPLPALFSMDTEGRVIYMNTFTKTLASTIRVSYMILPEKLMDRFRAEMGFYSCSVSTFEQYTLARFIGQGYFEKHINRMRNSGRRQRDLILDEIEKSPLGSITHIFEEHAGLHFLMNIALKRPAEEFLKDLEQRGIRLVPLSRYYIEEPETGDRPVWLVGDGKAEHTFVVNYSSVPAERIGEAVRRISQAAGVA